VVTFYEPTTNPRLVHLDMETVFNGKLEDLAGRGAHAAFVGTTAAAGRVGGARSFNGVGDVVTVAHHPALNPTDRMTVSAWIYRRTAPANFWSRILTKENPTVGYHMWVDAANALQFCLVVGGVYKCVNSYHAGGRFLSLNTWHQIVAVYNGAVVRMYVDGVGWAGDAASGPIDGNTNSLKIGNQYYGFDGVIDEVQLFDRALADAEVLSIYQGTEKGSYSKQYFDSLGRATKSVRRDMFSALTSWEASAYNYRDLAVSHTVSRSSTTSFTTTAAYDFLGRPTSATYPDFPSNPLTLTYDDVNRVRTVVAENGRKTQYLSDIGGRTTTVREYYDPTNYYTTTYGYDEVGNLLTVTNARNQVTSHQYDNLNRLTKTTYPDTTKYEQYTFDEIGNLKTRRDRAAIVTTYHYDNRYRLVGIDHSTDGSWDVSYSYDANDNPWTTTTMTGVTTTIAYDGLDRVDMETTSVGGSSYPVDYNYDPAGRVTRLTYPDGYAVDYTYDAVGRTREAKSGATTFATFTYNADDLIKDVTFGNQVVQSFSYNGRGWPTSILASYGATPYLDLTNGYDASGNILSVGGTTQAAHSFTYDKLDRLATALGGYGSQTNVYDALGNRKRPDSGATFEGPPWALDPGSFYGDLSTTWTTNPGTGQAWTAAEVNALEAGIRLDSTNALPRVTQVFVTVQINGGPVVLRPNGAGASTGWTKSGTGGANWDRVDEATSDADATYVRASLPGATDLYALGDLGTTGPISQVTVTAMGRVPTPCEGTCWANLRLVVRSNTGGYIYADGPSGMNELLTTVDLSGATTSYAYDANGNLDTKTGGWDYDWNPENLMTAAKLNGNPQESYTYDGLGRRVKVDGAAGSGVWMVSIIAGMDTIYEKDQSGAVTKYVYANGMRIAKITPSGTVHYYLGDHLGSTRKVLDASRNTIFSTEYEPFGKPYSVTGTEAYKYTMEKHDDPTGFVYLRARQYDPDLGRFVSADPVLGVPAFPQTLNRYTYVVNNPLRYTDPTGEVIPLLVIAAIVILGGGAAAGAVSHFVPESRPYLNPVADIVGLVPLYGDVFDLGYYGTQGGLDCAAGSCDPVAIGVNLGGSVPFVGDLGKAVKYGGAAVGFFGLVTKGGRNADSASDLFKMIDRADFASPGGLTRHFDDHALKMGYRTSDDYLAGARSLLREGVQGKAEVWRAGRHVMAVDPSSGRWVKLDTTSGIIRTFFVPDEGYSYIARQIREQGWVRFYVG